MWWRKSWICATDTWETPPQFRENIPTFLLWLWLCQWTHKIPFILLVTLWYSPQDWLLLSTNQGSDKQQIWWVCALKVQLWPLPWLSVPVYRWLIYWWFVMCLWFRQRKFKQNVTELLQCLSRRFSLLPWSVVAFQAARIWNTLWVRETSTSWLNQTYFFFQLGLVFP